MKSGKCVTVSLSVNPTTKPLSGFRVVSKDWFSKENRLAREFSHEYCMTAVDRSV